MNEMIKSIRMGTVDFFGILIPGLLTIVICATGFFIPIVLLILDLTETNNARWAVADSVLIAFILFVLIVLSYVLGYILRLSSPDELDKISAKYVIKREREISKYFEEDEWPYNPEDALDKYPYFNFRNYLIRRGHVHLIKNLVTWGPDEKVMNDEFWPDKGEDGKPVKITKRSKSTVNRMKIDIRLYCPDLTGLLESKEGHIRLMSGTWAAFKYSKWLVGGTFLFLAGFIVSIHWPGRFTSVWKPDQNYYLLAFISLTMWLLVHFAKRRIERLFHYRRVNELFHIVQSAYLAYQQKDAITKSRTREDRQRK